MNLVARKSITPILTTSVPVVKKMLDAAAGSAPHLLRNTGTNAPINPLTTQLASMETKIIMARAKLAKGPAATIIDLWYKGFNINNLFLSSSLYLLIISCCSA